jgi:hypothetical protein
MSGRFVARAASTFSQPSIDKVLTAPEGEEGVVAGVVGGRWELRIFSGFRWQDAYLKLPRSATLSGQRGQALIIILMNHPIRKFKSLACLDLITYFVQRDAHL